jgi:hypothetical protein
MLARASFKIKKQNIFAQNYTNGKHQSKKSSKGFSEWMVIFESFRPMELTALSNQL